MYHIYFDFTNFQYLPGQGDHALFTPPSSTSGTDSSIRIRRSGSRCTERRWFISVSLAMVFTLLIASAGIYFGCKYFFPKMYFFFFPTRLAKTSVFLCYNSFSRRGGKVSVKSNYWFLVSTTFSAAIIYG